MTYILHHAPDNASLVVRLVLEELGLDYHTQLVDRAVRAQEKAAYRRINPAGLIPALETPNGTLFETAAIILWLADTHGRMAPEPDAPQRAAFLSHLQFASNTLHAQLRMTFNPDKYVWDDQSAQDQLRRTLQSSTTTAMTLPNALALLDCWYAKDNHTYGPTVLDYYLAALLRWCALYPRGQTQWYDLRNYPALWSLVKKLEARPATHAAQVAEGLGPRPFTQPQYATPPEGSAT